MNQRFSSLKEFYPYYLTEHDKQLTRTLHYIGSFFAIVLLFAALFYKSSLAYWIPIVGYGFAWTGHYFIEKNKPATFQYPLYSLASDFIMFYHFLSFQLKSKLEAAKKNIIK